MNNEDVIRLAREAGMAEPTEFLYNNYWTAGQSELERFAALVAETEREACALMAESMRPNGGRAWDDAQRECFSALTDLAAAIRARKSE